ncbi:hypothetical protein AO063_00910 [Pseudomonas fluorescens ICMP 11288]|uniref:Uncharacterized protein n=1 Tax=Pseudomonas fluorescens ICMP 11288 TaxID=1198309 RepID=A0A0W0I5D1_PSEFL|nr:hypothetical protein AO063_00910 [Pseudomonas fluorescens ICMP 11288]
MIEFPCTCTTLVVFKRSLFLGIAIRLSVLSSQTRALFRATLNLVLTIYIHQAVVGLMTNTKGVIERCIKMFIFYNSWV